MSWLPGREEELAALSGVLRRTQRGEAIVVTVEGPAGIGKSALLQAFAAVQAREERVVWLRCDRRERDVDFAAVEVLLGAEMPAERGELGVARALLARLGDLHHRQHRVTVLIIDDAHWMDAASARALRFVLRRLQVERLLTIVSQRPRSAHATPFETAHPARTLELRLNPLDSSAVTALARGLRGWELGKSTAERVVEFTGGLPLLLDIVLRQVPDPSRLATGDLPRSAFSSTLRLLESLETTSRPMVEAAAVFGEPTDGIVLSAVAFGESTRSADQIEGIAGAVAAGLLMEDRGTVQIPHAVLSQAVYDSLPPDRRRALHRRAARWTTGGRQLEHRASSAQGTDPALVADLVAAAEMARAERRYAQAANAREWARSLSPDQHQRDELLLQALLERVSAQDLLGADRLGAEAEKMPASPLRSLALGLLRREQTRIAEAESHLQLAMRTAPTQAPALHPRAALALAVLQGRLHQGAAAVETLRAVGVQDDEELACDIDTTKAVCLWHAGRPDAAGEVLTRRPRSPHATAWEAEQWAARGMVRLYAGRLGSALEDLNRSIELSHLWRPSTNQVRVYLLRCQVRFRLGDWDGAAVDAEAGQTIAASQGQLWSLSLASAMSVPVPAWRGQWDTAQRHLDEGSAALTPQLLRAEVGTMLDLSRLQLFEARGEHDRLLAALEPMMAQDELERLSPYRSYRRVLPPWIRSCLATGRVADARHALNRYEGLVVRWPNGQEASALGLLRGLVAQAVGDIDLARRHFAGDFADPDVRVRPLQLAQLQHAAGRLEAVAGNQEAAVAHLSDAITGFTRLKAVPLLKNCRSDLGALGAIGPREPVSEEWGLTERENFVAAFVRRGFTNKEIAAELFVTSKAVEYHLTRIYAKVGVRGRHELRRMPLTRDERSLTDV